MGNQQERLLTPEFIAGLVVGEGCFCLPYSRVKTRKNGQGFRITPKFTLFMNDHDTVLAVAESLKGNDLPVYIQKRKDGGLGIVAQGHKRVRRYLDFMLPHLTGTKLKSAEIVSQFIEERSSHSPWSGYSEREIELFNSLKLVNGNSPNKKTIRSIPRD